MTTATALGIERDGAVATLTLSRPELLNRFDQELHAEFISALDELSGDQGIRAVVLASTGKVFSAGGDFELMRRAHDDAETRRAIVNDARKLFTSLIELPQPVIAAMHGAAIGLGATVVLGCDAVVAARKASIADSHVAIGLVAGDGGCVVWPAAAGMLRARRHLLTGDPLDAETAYGLGLITDLVDTPEEVLPAAQDLAGRIAELPWLAVQLTKRALTQPLLRQGATALDLGLAYEEATLASDDVLKEIERFKERR